MTIYTSEKVMPYVYMGTHRVTGEFYIGSRYTKTLKHPSHVDIHKYRTSSKRVKPVFDEFDWVIVAEFFDPKSAYECEQQLIYENWDSPLILNGVCRHTNTNMFAPAVSSMTEERKQHIRETNSKRLGVFRHSKETILKMSAAKLNIPQGPHSDTTKQRISAAHTGMKFADEHRETHRVATAAANRKRCTGKKRDPDIAKKAWETRRLNSHQ